ncbi:hypothetical protein IAT38_001698 [Cryptococcus sp. DSM 104549]
MTRPPLREWYAQQRTPKLTELKSSPILHDLPLEIISNIVSVTTHTPTLLAFCLVNRFLLHDARAALYSVVHLHSPRAVVKYLTRNTSCFPSRYQTRHLDVVLDADTLVGPATPGAMGWEIRRLLYEVLRAGMREEDEKHKMREARGDMDEDSDDEEEDPALDTLHFTLTDRHRLIPHQDEDSVYNFVDLTEYCLSRLGGWPGPLHFRWQYLDLSPYSEVHDQNSQKSYVCRCTCYTRPVRFPGSICMCIPRQVLPHEMLSLLSPVYNRTISIERPPLRELSFDDPDTGETLVSPDNESYPSIQHSSADWRQLAIIRFPPTHRHDPIPPGYSDILSFAMGDTPPLTERIPCRCGERDKWGRPLPRKSHTLSWLTRADEWREVIVQKPWEKEFNAEAYRVRKREEEIMMGEPRAMGAPVKATCKRVCHKHRGPKNEKFGEGLKRKRYCVVHKYGAEKDGCVYRQAPDRWSSRPFYQY